MIGISTTHSAQFLIAPVTTHQRSGSTLAAATAAAATSAAAAAAAAAARPTESEAQAVTLLSREGPGRPLNAPTGAPAIPLGNGNMDSSGYRIRICLVLVS